MPAKFSQSYHKHMSNRTIYPRLPAHLHPKGVNRRNSDYDGELPDPKEVQGDVYLLLPKVGSPRTYTRILIDLHIQSAESFVFFVIRNRKLFKHNLANYTPTSSYDVLHHLHDISEAKDKYKPNESDRNSKYHVELAATNIAFTRRGLDFLGEEQDTMDARFDYSTMRKDKEYLGDTSEWDDFFDRGKLDGVFIVAASSE